jgi:Glyoxalase/Bleomycin resistance protein/Dioxygenase superfamily
MQLHPLTPERLGRGDQAHPERPHRSNWGRLPESQWVGQHPEESDMIGPRKARAVGFNHVALEVGDIDEALAFYSGLFDFKLRGKNATSAFIDLGDQFLALQKGRTQPVGASFWTCGRR